MDIMTALFDDDVIQEMYENSLREEGRKEGEKVGREEGEKIGREEGEKIGHEEGEKVGREEGEKIGREEGEKVGREEGEKIGEERGSELRGYDAVDKIVADGKYDVREACEILNVNYEGYKAYKACESQ